MIKIKVDGMGSTTWDIVKKEVREKIANNPDRIGDSLVELTIKFIEFVILVSLKEGKHGTSKKS